MNVMGAVCDACEVAFESRSVPFDVRKAQCLYCGGKLRPLSFKDEYPKLTVNPPSQYGRATEKTDRIFGKPEKSRAWGTV